MSSLKKMGLMIVPSVGEMSASWSYIYPSKFEGSITGITYGLQLLYYFEKLYGGLEYNQGGLTLKNDSSDPALFKSATDVSLKEFNLILGKKMWGSLGLFVAFGASDKLVVSDTSITNTDGDIELVKSRIDGTSWKIGFSYDFLNNIRLEASYQRHTYTNYSYSLSTDSASDDDYSYSSDDEVTPNLPHRLHINAFLLKASFPFHFSY